MEINVNAFMVKNMDEIERFYIKVDDKNFILVRKKLEEQKNKIVNILKKLKEEGLITSIFRPANKKISKQLNNLVVTKQLIKRSIEQIKIGFYK